MEGENTGCEWKIFLKLFKMIKCKKIFYTSVDNTLVFAYNMSKRIKGGHHNEV